MIKTGWKFWVQHEPERDGHRLIIIYEDADKRSVVRNLVLEDLEPHSMISPASEYLIEPGQVEDFLRAAMDAAWEMGLRPTGFKDHTNELTAVRYHLEDMRKLAKVIR